MDGLTATDEEQLSERTATDESPEATQRLIANSRHL
jgi:hypothetical protein